MPGGGRQVGAQRAHAAPAVRRAGRARGRPRAPSRRPRARPPGTCRRAARHRRPRRERARARRRVERGRRLVEEDEPRRMQEDERQADALALPHREAVDPQLGDLVRDRSAWSSSWIAAARASRVEQREPRPQVEVALHGHARVEPAVARASAGRSGAGRRGGACRAAIPSSRTLPRSGATSPPMIRSSVVLPAPLRPVTETTSPAFSSRSRSSSVGAGRPRQVLAQPSTASSGSATSPDVG